MQASDVKEEGKKHSQRHRMLEELYKKYCIGGGAKSDQQVGLAEVSSA
jgi:hypothetical protein